MNVRERLEFSSIEVFILCQKLGFDPLFPLVGPILKVNSPSNWLLKTRENPVMACEIP